MKLSPKNTPFRVTLGERGEMVACQYLAEHGFRILEKNYRCKIGEIDVVAVKNGRLVFVEIKTRSQEVFGRPEESVGWAKQRKMTRLAEWYLKDKKKTDASVSFAVLAVHWKGTQDPEIRLIENAFTAEGWAL